MSYPFQMRSPFRRQSPFGDAVNDNYVFGGQSAELVIDDAGVNRGGIPYYRFNGEATTHKGVFGTARDRSDAATMFDAAGTLVWSCHNLVDTPDAPVTQSITVVSGAQYTVKMLGTGSVTLSNAGTGTATEGSGVTITAASTTLTLTVSGSVDDMWAFRSDLGGMATVPADERGNASEADYVDGGPRFLGRREAYRYNGSSWVIDGHIQEPAATNDFVQPSFANAAWSLGSSSATKVTGYATSPDGNTNATRLIDDNSTGTGVGQLTEGVTLTSATETIFWAMVKADQLDFAILKTAAFDAGANGTSWFNISAGTKGTINHDNSWIFPIGDGWYVIAISITSTTDVAGFVAVGMAQTNGSESVDLDGTSSILVYQGQLEEGSFPTSFIPDGTATRATDPTTDQVVAALHPGNSTAFTTVMKGRISYADTAAAIEAEFFRIEIDASNRTIDYMNCASTNTGKITTQQETAGVLDIEDMTPEYSPGVGVAFAVAFKHTESEINVSKDGASGAGQAVAPVAMFDASSPNLDMCRVFTGSHHLTMMFGADIGDAGREEATA